MRYIDADPSCIVMQLPKQLDEPTYTLKTHAFYMWYYTYVLHVFKSKGVAIKKLCKKCNEYRIKNVLLKECL